VPLALGLCLAPAVAIGFGRFAYALILPAIRINLGWSYAQAGGLNTANAVGYLLGAVLTTPVVQRFSARQALLGGLWLVVVALALSGFSAVYSVALLARAIVGAAGAVVFIAGAGLAARLGESAIDNALAMGLYFSGPGVGTVITGLCLPPLLTGAGAASWRLAWLLLAGGGIVATIIVLVVSRPLAVSTTRTNSAAVAPAANWKVLGPGLAAYFGFGLGYIAYMTFLIAYVRAHGASTGIVVAVWTVLGIAMTASGPVWRGPLSRWTGGRPMALMLAMVGAGAALPLVSETLPVLLLSATLFGLAAMAIVTALTVLIRRLLPQELWNLAIAVATVIFAVGQSLGPLGSGALSDHFGLKASLVWTTIILCVSSVLAIMQQDEK